MTDSPEGTSVRARLDMLIASEFYPVESTNQERVLARVVKFLADELDKTDSIVLGLDKYRGQVEQGFRDLQSEIGRLRAEMDVDKLLQMKLAKDSARAEMEQRPRVRRVERVPFVVEEENPPKSAPTANGEPQTASDAPKVDSAIGAELLATFDAAIADVRAKKSTSIIDLGFLHGFESGLWAAKFAVLAAVRGRR